MPPPLTVRGTARGGFGACGFGSLFTKILVLQHTTIWEEMNHEILQKGKRQASCLRIDSELHCKLHYISQYDGRSANGEVIYLIRQRIEQFEREHGRIELPD